MRRPAHAAVCCTSQWSIGSAMTCCWRCLQGVQLGAGPRGMNRMQAGMRRRGRAGRAARGSDSEEEEEEVTQAAVGNAPRTLHKTAMLPVFAAACTRLPKVHLLQLAGPHREQRSLINSLAISGGLCWGAGGGGGRQEGGAASSSRSRPGGAGRGAGGQGEQAQRESSRPH